MFRLLTRQEKRRCTHVVSCIRNTDEHMDSTGTMGYGPWPFSATEKVSQLKTGPGKGSHLGQDPSAVVLFLWEYYRAHFG